MTALSIFALWVMFMKKQTGFQINFLSFHWGETKRKFSGMTLVFDGGAA